MDWIFLAIIGAVLGGIVSFAALNLRMPQSLTVFLGVLGSLAGGFLAHITDFSSFGQWTFYVAGVALAIVVIAGGILGYSLTNEEKRI